MTQSKWTDAEEAWLEQQLALAPKMSEVMRDELAALLARQDREQLLREQMAKKTAPD